MVVNMGDTDDESAHEDSSDDDELDTTTTTTNKNVKLTHVNTEVSRIFQHNITEEKNQMTLLQIRRTVGDRFFPIMKFTNEYILRQMKLREENNMIHLLLQDLNRLDDDDISRAKFWLTYKNEVKQVLTTRKTEVSNQMKQAVLLCKYCLNPIAIIILDIANIIIFSTQYRATGSK